MLPSAAVGWLNIVVIGWLIGDTRDRHRLPDTEPADLIHLPEVVVVLVAPRGSTDNHAEHRFGAVEVHGRITNRDGVGALKTAVAIPRFDREVALRAVRVTYPQITTARDALHTAHVVGEHRTDRGEILRDRNLSHEHDRVGQIGGGGRIGRSQSVNQKDGKGGVPKMRFEPS